MCLHESTAERLCFCCGGRRLPSAGSTCSASEETVLEPVDIAQENPDPERRCPATRHQGQAGAAMPGSPSSPPTPGFGSSEAKPTW